MLRKNSGWGRSNELFEVFLDIQRDRAECIAEGINPRTRLPFTGELLEAFQNGTVEQLLETDGRADFRSYLWEPINAGFYRGYQSVAGQYDKYTGKRSLDSFDIHRVKGYNGLKGFAYVGENGEYVDVLRTFRPEYNIALDTYGGTYHVTRPLVRSKGAKEILDKIPEDMGKGLAIFFTELVVAFIVANPNAPDGAPVYSGGRGNLVTSVLDENSFLSMAAWLRTRKDPDGRPIRMSVKTAVTQNDIPAARLRQILQSMELQATGVSTTAMASDKFGRGTSNPIPGAGVMNASDIVIDPFLPDAEDVYFFSDPNDQPAFERGYLDGEEDPFLGMEDATVMHLSQSNGSGFDPYSLQADRLSYKGRHDFAIQAVEPLATYKISPA